MFENTKEFLDSILEMGIPGFDCIAYKDGKEIFRYMNGYRDRENKIPVDGTEKYNIYSASKPFTCTAALQLWEKGLFSLDDKLSKYIPEFSEMTVQTEEGIKKAKNEITLLDLFRMTAGFNYATNSPSLQLAKKETAGRCPTVETIKYLAREPLSFEPGTRYMYSLCHDVIAALVEIISGKRFGEYVKENIFDVLSMENTTFDRDSVNDDDIACQFQYNSETKEYRQISKAISTYRLGTDYESGGAGAVSTVNDYIKFLEALRVGNVVLKKETIDYMSTNKLTEKQLQTYGNPGYGYGLGMRTPLSNPLSNFGWGGAAGAHLAIYQKLGVTVFYAQHVLLSPVQPIRRKIGDIIIKDIFGEPLADITENPSENKTTLY